MIRISREVREQNLIYLFRLCREARELLDRIDQDSERTLNISLKEACGPLANKIRLALMIEDRAEVEKAGDDL